MNTEASNPLVSAAWLLENANPNLRVVDVRFLLGQPNAGLEAYRTGHIPGAVFLDLERDLSAPKQSDGRGGRHPLPDPQVLAAKLGALGIGNQHHVVAYDDPSSGQGFYAAHLWWLLRWLGHDQVSVLDGGFPAWQALVSPEAVSPDGAMHEPVLFQTQVRPEMLVDAEQVKNRDLHSTLIDSRAAPRYRGEVEPIDQKAGHIPGAINRDWAAGLEADGRFKVAHAQLQRFADLPKDGFLVYCGSGVSACANLLALELAGISARLYAGSWSDWICQSDAPIAVGDGPG